MVCILDQNFLDRNKYIITGSFVLNETVNNNSSVIAYSLKAFSRLKGLETKNYQLLESDQDKLLFFFCHINLYEKIPNPSKELAKLYSDYKFFMSYVMMARKRFRSERDGDDINDEMLNFLTENDNYEKFSKQFSNVDEEVKKSFYNVVIGNDTTKNSKFLTLLWIIGLQILQIS